MYVLMYNFFATLNVLTFSSAAASERYKTAVRGRCLFTLLQTSTTFLLPSSCLYHIWFLFLDVSMRVKLCTGHVNWLAGFTDANKCPQVRKKDLCRHYPIYTYICICMYVLKYTYVPIYIPS